MDRALFRLSDQPDKRGGRIQIELSEAKEWNNDRNQWGIYWAVNQFKPGETKFIKENVDKILAWFCELDGNKEELETYLQTVPLYPSMIVESKNGYHLYWNAEDGATIENYKDIQNRIQYTVSKADKNCKDIARILRVPGYMHWKDTNDPFKVKIYDNIGNTYDEETMRTFFPEVPKAAPKKTAARKRDIFDEEGWDDYYPSLDALKAMSGTRFVNGDTYAFARNSNGTFQIIVNGGSTACWVDNKGMIGSHSGGGPTIIQWLRWYGLDNATMREAVKYLDNVMAEKGVSKCVTTN